MKNRYFKIFGLATGMFFLNHAEGMNEKHTNQGAFSNLTEINDNSNSDETAEPEPVYENSPLVRNYKSEYEEKFRDFDPDKKMTFISDHIVKTYFRLLETTTLDQQRPLFARWEALALMLIQTKIPSVQTIRQLLDDKYCLQSTWSFPSRNSFLKNLKKHKNSEYLMKVGRQILRTLVSLQDLFMEQLEDNTDLTCHFSYLTLGLRVWKVIALPREPLVESIPQTCHEENAWEHTRNDLDRTFLGTFPTNDIIPSGQWEHPRQTPQAVLGQWATWQLRLTTLDSSGSESDS